MRPFLVLLLIVLFLFIILLFCSTEGFVGSSLITPALQAHYQQFLNFYKPFMTSWEQAVTTSIGLGITQAPLASPKQINLSSTPPPPSQDQMNQHIVQMEKDEKTTFPFITSLPDTLTEQTLPLILELLPHDPSPFKNALQFMNDHLEKAHSGLDAALHPTEGFDGTCQCDPQEIAKIVQQQQQQQAQQQQQQQQAQQQQQLNELDAILTAFTSNTELQQAMSHNQDLVAKSNQIKEDAQSGALFSQFQAPTSTSSYPTTNQYEKWNKDRAEQSGLPAGLIGLINTLQGIHVRN
jgi:hypothetical protein